jgi:phosphate transport system ATP-binding protein
MNDQIDGTCSTGNIYFDIGINIKSKNLNILELNTRVGMIFQKPTPFPMSIYDNVAYGLRSHGINNKKILDKLIKEALIDAAL